MRLPQATRMVRQMIAGVGFVLLTCFGGCQCAGDCPNDDHNPCTLDQCENGKTAHNALPDGAICYSGKSAGTCEAGVCFIPCLGPKECDDGNFCTSDDCQANYCVHIADNSLTPPDGDGNPCTHSACSDGDVLYFPNNGEDCGGGTCVGDICDTCATPADCGEDTICRSWSCESGLCEPVYKDEGTPVLFGNLIGDCREKVCDGFGASVDVPHEEDLPEDDGNPCTKEKCIGWTPYHEPLGEGLWCPEGVCNADGECVECTIDTHCGQKYCYQNGCYSCDNGIQDGNELGIDCGGSCVVKCLGQACSQDSECGSGHCADGVCCTKACGICSSCISAGLVGTCKIVPQYEDDPPACAIANGKSCNGGGTCKTALGFACNINFDCVSGICKSNICAAMP